MSNVWQELRSSEADHQVHEFWKQLRAENGLAEKLINMVMVLL